MVPEGVPEGVHNHIEEEALVIDCNCLYSDPNTSNVDDRDRTYF